MPQVGKHLFMHAGFNNGAPSLDGATKTVETLPLGLDFHQSLLAWSPADPQHVYLETATKDDYGCSTHRLTGKTLPCHTDGKKARMYLSFAHQFNVTDRG